MKTFSSLIFIILVTLSLGAESSKSTWSAPYIGSDSTVLYLPGANATQSKQAE